MADIRVTINGIEFANPVLTAAGPQIRTRAQLQAAVAGGAGGIVTKTVSVRPAADPRPTIRRTAGTGLMNCETWAECPPKEILTECRVVKDAGVPLVVSIGYSAADVAELGPWVEKEFSPAAIEFSTHYTGREMAPLLAVARALRAKVRVPIWMKISPGCPEIEALAEAVQPYVDAFVAVNSYGPVLDLDIETGGPLLGSAGGQGWLSGPPLQPIALQIVHRLATIQEKPVIGVGGIGRGTDVIKFVMAGATAVQVCSAAIREGNAVYSKIATECASWLDEHGYAGLADIRGLYTRRLAESTPLDRTARMTVDESHCTGCKACLNRCVQGAISMPGTVAVIDPQCCIGCGFCQDFCRFDALSLQTARHPAG
ncbi:MAG: 4Fe-4S binding protein [Acidobacteria bacterium]|nr:4Fe-4S binding protein [Acidobacteriota bacterium]